MQASMQASQRSGASFGSFPMADPREEQAEVERNIRVGKKVYHLVSKAARKLNLEYDISKLEQEQHLLKQFKNIQSMSRRQRFLKKKKGIPTLVRRSHGNRTLNYKIAEYEISFEVLDAENQDPYPRVLCVNIRDAIEENRWYDRFIVFSLCFSNLFSNGIKK